MYTYNRQQDDELDMLSASVQRIGGVGLTIHEELVGQVLINKYGILEIVFVCFLQIILTDFLSIYIHEEPC
jgi:hypothetical protein